MGKNQIFPEGRGLKWGKKWKDEGSEMMGEGGWVDLAQFWMRLSGKNFTLTFQVRIKYLGQVRGLDSLR